MIQVALKGWSIDGSEAGRQPLHIADFVQNKAVRRLIQCLLERAGVELVDKGGVDVKLVVAHYHGRINRGLVRDELVGGR